MISPRDASPTATSKFPSPTVKQRILVILGTRPEAIKLAPLIRHLRGSAEMHTIVCATGQHREMLQDVFRAFSISPDYQLDIMQSGQTLSGTTARLMAALEPVFTETAPALAVVQGDTTTTFCGALSAFYRHVPVAHVEAGLRTGSLQAPFPEEANRTLTTRLAALHFAPAETARTNLLREGVSGDAILVTGNTGIDSVLHVRDALVSGALSGYAGQLPAAKHLLLVTAHRRESFGEPLAQIAGAVARLAERPDVHVLWPVHPNPQVHATVYRVLRNNAHVSLLPPVPYVPFVDLMRKATIILTDSGGIQEEAPSLGKPVLVLRESTERREAVEAGTVKLVGSDADTIFEEAVRLLDNLSERDRMSRIHNPYGDGHAAEGIAGRIASFLQHQP